MGWATEEGGEVVYAAVETSITKVSEYIYPPKWMSGGNSWYASHLGYKKGGKLLMSYTEKYTLCFSYDELKEIPLGTTLYAVWENV